jgi:5-methylcytosine-specific restriction endonuclease McrA
MKKEQINNLKEAFEEWLQIHDLDYDFTFYTGDEWRAKGEGFLEKAEAVLLFENQLVDILNYTGPWNIEEELQDLAGGFGYYFELGHTWNLGFYPLDNIEPFPPQSTSYSEQLRHARWLAKRKRIISRSGGRCEDCGGKAADVHHCYYRYGRFPWQYPDASLIHLCRPCHEARGKVELKFRGFLPQLRSSEILTLHKALKDGLYWYPRKPLWEFIGRIGHDIEECDSRLKSLKPLRGHEKDREA